MTEPPPRDPWFSADTRAGVVADVRAIEARSRAEVVVTVRAAADAYRDGADEPMRRRIDDWLRAHG